MDWIMRPVYYMFIVVVLCLLKLVTCAEFSLNTPPHLRHNTEESVIVTAVHVNPRQTVTTHVQVVTDDGNSAVFLSRKKRYTLTRSETHHVFHIPIKISPTPDECPDANSGNRDNLCLVKLLVSVTEMSVLLWSKTTRLQVVKRPAQLYIQADRPIYSPGDEVHLRFLSTTETLLPLNERALIIIETPGGGDTMKSRKKKISFTDVTSLLKFRLPANCPLGRWNISASYTKPTMTSFTYRAGFYVEYTNFPSFSVVVKYTRNDFILPHDEDFSMQLVARTFHGEPVSGSAHVRFGIAFEHDESLTRTTHVLSNLDLTDGVVELSVPISQIVGTSPAFQAGMRLLIVASVTKYGSGETRTTREDVVTFSSEPYTIAFRNSKQNYRTEVPWLVYVELKFPNGSVAVDKDVSLTITSFDLVGSQRIISQSTVQTGQLGTAMLKYEAPQDSHRIGISATVEYIGHNGHRYSTTEGRILVVEVTPTDDYITIEEPQKRLVVGEPAVVQAYSKPSEADKLIFYTVMKNRQLLSSDSFLIPIGNANFLFRIPITADMSPSVVLTGYYFTEAGSIVQDRVLLRIERRCIGNQLEVLASGGEELPLPGSEVSLQVNSEPSSTVSMTAGDVALKSLRKEYDNPTSLDRDAINRWQEDQTCAQAQHGLCMVQTVSRTKRSVSRNRLQSAIDDIAYGSTGAAYDCCIVGARDLTRVHGSANETCEERLNRVQLDDDCRAAFLECCQMASCIRENPTSPDACRTSLFDVPGSRSVGGQMHISQFTESMASSFMVERAVTLLRKNFNPIWFFIDFKMDASGTKLLNLRSTPNIPKLPDAITTWNVDVLSISQDAGMCFGDPLEIPVKHSIYIEVLAPIRPVIVGSQISIEVTIYNHMSNQVEVSVILEGVEGLCSGAKPGKDSEPVSYVMAPGHDSIPTTNAARFIVVPLTAGDFIIKVKMNGLPSGSFRPMTDIVEKTIQVIPEGNVKKEVDWVLVDSRDPRASRSRGQPRRRLLNLPVRTDAIPGTLKTEMTWHSVSSAAMLTPPSNNQPSATIQEILYQLHPAISKLEYAEYAVDLSEEDRNRVMQTVVECYNALLAFVRKGEFQHRVDGNAYETYGFSYSPATNSKPSMKLTSSVAKLLYKAATLTDIDMNLLQGCLRWIALHQTPLGYFRAKPLLPNIRARLSQKSAVYPGHRLFMTTVDRKIYLTSIVMLDLISIKESLHNLTSRSDISEDERGNSTSLQNLINENIRLGESYVQSKLLEKGPITECHSSMPLTAASHAVYRLHRRETYNVRRWQRFAGPNSFRAGTNWIETCLYNPASLSFNPTIAKSTSVEATAHALLETNLKGDRGEGFANWLIYERNIEGHWGSFRATLAATEALKSYNLIEEGLKENSFPDIELTDPEMVTKTTLLKHEKPIEVTRARHALSFTSSGFGMSWVKLETTYSLASVTPSPRKLVKSRRRRSADSTSVCPYEIDISIKLADDLFLESRAPRRSRVAWTVSIDIQVVPPLVEYESYVVDFGLPLGSKPFGDDLEMLFNPIEQVLDHYRLTDRSVLLYMSGNQNIAFRITDPRSKNDPIPVIIFPVSSPDVRCKEFYNFPGLPYAAYTFCGGAQPSTSPCHCAMGKNCPVLVKTKKSGKTTLDKRLNLTCPAKTTAFAYKVLLKEKAKFDDNWFRYLGQIEKVFRQADGSQIEVSRKHAFWVKATCKKIGLKKSYLIIGQIVIPGNRNGYEHLLDGDSWVEPWKVVTNCNKKKKVSKACKALSKLEEYEYTMDRSPCPATTTANPNPKIG